MNSQARAKFIISNFGLIRRTNCPSDVISNMFNIGIRGHDIKMILEFVAEKVGV